MNDTPPTKNQKPLTGYLENFLDWLDIEKGLLSKSQENYSNFLKIFFDWLRSQKLEATRPAEITSDLVWRYRVFLSRHRSLQRRTQNYYLIALRSLLTFFTERDIVSLPPEKIKLSQNKETQKEVRFLNREQLRRFFGGPDIATARGLRDRAILETLFSTGLRIAELVALNRDQIKIPKNPGDELEVVVIGKGNRTRTVYFSARALGWLKRYLDKRPDACEALFVSHRGKKPENASRIPPRTVQAMFKKNALKTGIPLNTTPHVMRHSFATDLMSQGVDVRAIQEFLGHKNIAATQIYTHVTNKQLKEIHKKFHGL